MLSKIKNRKLLLDLKLDIISAQSYGEIMKFKARKSWCEELRDQKYFNKKEFIIEKIDFLISPAYSVPPMMTVCSSKEMMTKAPELVPSTSGFAWK